MIAGGLQKRVLRATALVIICVFASLPTLVRIHDRLTPRSDEGRFRVSKNLERPHEKIAPAVLDGVICQRAARDDAVDRVVVSPATAVVPHATAAPLAPRAPPVR